MTDAQITFDTIKLKGIPELARDDDREASNEHIVVENGVGSDAPRVRIQRPVGHQPITQRGVGVRGLGEKRGEKKGFRR
jgi:hypothetical protein